MLSERGQVEDDRREVAAMVADRRAAMIKARLLQWQWQKRGCCNDQGATTVEKGCP